MRRVTLREVAERAGVTPATVSMILNGKNTFKETTVATVRQALQDLQYFPNTTAKRLATRRTETVAFVLENIESAFEVELLKGIQGQAVHQGYDILFLSMATHQKPYSELVKNLARSGKVDGIISTDQTLDPSVQEVLDASGIPFVLLENSQYTLDNVRSDNLTGGALAARHFLERGIRHPAVVHGPLDSTWMRQRIGSFLETLAAEGVNVPPEDQFAMEYGGDLVVRGHEVTPLLCDGPRCRYDGLFVAAGDEVALGILQDLLGRGIRIPQDVRVLGYDGIPAGQLIYPSLSTVHQDIQRLGALAFGRLIERLEFPNGSPLDDGTRAQVLQPTLVLRQSSP